MSTNQAIFGVLAAVGAPFFMATGFIIWDKIWKIGQGSAFALNLFKCNLAAVWFLVVSFVFGWKTRTNGTDDLEPIFSINSVGFLVLSGFIGIIVGDLAWLEALRLLGATQVFLIDSLKPFSAALMGWLILGEAVNPIAYSGIVLTIVGILIVSFEKEKQSVPKELPQDECDNESENVKNEGDNKHHKNDIELMVEDVSDDVMSDEKGIHKSHFCFRSSRGYVFAVGNVFLDTYGSLLTKQYGIGMSTFAINLIRFGSAGVFMASVTILMIICQNKNAAASSKQNQAWFLLPRLSVRDWMKICVGVAFVTFLCPSLSNYALFQINLALALTLGSITPFYALFLEWSFYGKKPSLNAFFGVCLTVGGVAILSIWHS